MEISEGRWRRLNMWIDFICNVNCRGRYFEVCDFESIHILIPPESSKMVTQPCWAMT
jgi:hypothetical protein